MHAFVSTGEGLRVTVTVRIFSFKYLNQLSYDY